MSKKALDQGNEYGALLNDRTKAFHCLAHGIIIAKRHAYGFSVESLKLIHSSLTLKRMGVGVSLTLLSPRYGFSKNVSSKENVKPCFFCDSQCYLKTNLSWKFHWISSSRSEDMKRLSVNISYFYQFSSTFRSFWHYLATKKLMTSAYNRWCQHFFTFKMIQIGCLSKLQKFSKSTFEWFENNSMKVPIPSGICFSFLY